MEDESPKVNVVSELNESRIELIEQPPEDASESEDKTQTTASASRVLGSRFHLIDEIGSGAWSKVYSAKDARLNNKLVAVKILHAHLLDGTEKLRRFQLEAETIGALKHQGIVRVYEYGCDGGEHPYLVTDLISGQSLAHRLANEGKLTVTESALLALQVADALSYAHSKGIIHRDVKPANIIIDGATKEAKLVDFGIVKTIATENTPELTQTGDIVGTPQYMSPEHCEGRALTGHSDVYSLGCIMWESIQGEKPFEGKSTFDCMRKHLELEPPPLFPDTKDEAQRAFADIVKACMSKSPESRLPADALKRTLELFIQGDYDSCREILSQYKKQDLSKEPSLAKQLGAGTTTIANQRNSSIRLLNCSLFLAIAGLWVYLLFLLIHLWFGTFEGPVAPEGTTGTISPVPEVATPPMVSSKDFLPHTPKAKYAQIAGGHSATFSRMLENAMIDVDSGVTQLKKDGKTAEAAKLTDKLNEFKFRFAQNSKKFFDKEKAEAMSASTPVHAVAVGQAPHLNIYTQQGRTTVAAGIPVILVLTPLGDDVVMSSIRVSGPVSILHAIEESECRNNLNHSLLVRPFRFRIAGPKALPPKATYYSRYFRCEFAGGNWT